VSQGWFSSTTTEYATLQSATINPGGARSFTIDVVAHRRGRTGIPKFEFGGVKVNSVDYLLLSLRLCFSGALLV
jgi:hypothetical protein